MTATIDGVRCPRCDERFSVAYRDVRITNRGVAVPLPCGHHTARWDRSLLSMLAYRAHGARTETTA